VPFERWRNRLHIPTLIAQLQKEEKEINLTNLSLSNISAF
jgi:hypothetical protein